MELMRQCCTFTVKYGLIYGLKRNEKKSQFVGKAVLKLAIFCTFVGITSSHLWAIFWPVGTAMPRFFGQIC